MAAFARNHGIPAEWAEKGVRKEDYVLPALRRMEKKNVFGFLLHRVFATAEPSGVAAISNPIGSVSSVAVDAIGNVYIGDSYIRKIDVSTGLMSNITVLTAIRRRRWRSTRRVTCMPPTFPGCGWWTRLRAPRQ